MVVALADKAAALTAMDGPKGSHSQKLSNPTENFVLEIIALEGNGSRPSHKGEGYRESDTMYTLNTTEVHGVAYPEGGVIAIDHVITTGGNCTAQGPCVYTNGICPTLKAAGVHAVALCTEVQDENLHTQNPKR